MTRDKLEELERLSAADPDNQSLIDQIYALKGRLEGPKVYIDLLTDRALWLKSSSALQDDAIRALSLKLEGQFQWLDTRLYDCGDQSFRIAAFRHKRTGCVLNLLPGGSFTRGQSWQRPETHLKIEVPPLLIGRFPVTQREWQAVADEDEDEFRASNLPMNLVSWNDVQEWLLKTGGLVLPAADHWEYACRAGTQTEFYWGDEMDDSYCWHSEHPDLSRAQDALAPTIHYDAKKWNAFGLVDMAGNIWEMCEDAFYGLLDINQYDNKVMKGGSWKNMSRVNSADYRGMVNCVERYNNIGFRVAYPLDSIISETASKTEELV
ncbi:MAG: formylglycine-generating enzyme family protein [Planctomycetota bacterium]|nr:formylglycine-generating enzyme family protein [Planctomycetota bacterium]